MLTDLTSGVSVVGSLPSTSVSSIFASSGGGDGGNGTCVGVTTSWGMSVGELDTISGEGASGATVFGTVGLMSIDLTLRGAG